MRRHGIVIHMVAFLALLMGFVPGSAVASLYSDSACQMACCTGKPAHESAKQPVDPTQKSERKGCCKPPASGPTFTTFVGSDGCRCSIESSSPPAPQPQTAAPTVSFSVQMVVADLEPVRMVAPEPIVIATVSGIYGTDSGPPISRPNYVSLGRAPPVHLA